MLLDLNKIAEGDVVSIKLVSGEEIIAKIVSESTDSFSLSKPMVLSISPKGMGLIPVFMTVSPQTVKLNKSNIMFGPAVTDKEIAEQYIFQVTGIQPVSAGSIVT